jgi:hypothetical protein
MQQLQLLASAQTSRRAWQQQQRAQSPRAIGIALITHRTNSSLPLQLLLLLLLWQLSLRPTNLELARKIQEVRVLGAWMSLLSSFLWGQATSGNTVRLLCTPTRQGCQSSKLSCAPTSLSSAFVAVLMFVVDR